jgi:phospholipase C accessory protein PlcR
MTAALLIDADPDPIKRDADLAASRRQWDAYAKETVGPSPAKDPRYQAYAQQSRAIFKEVQATVSDPAQQQVVIAQRLQALRVQLFDHASSPDTH